MILLEKVLKTSLQDVLRMSWRCFCKTSSRRLENVLKTSWRRMAKTNMLVFIKTSWRLLEDLFWRRMSKANILAVIKTSWRRLLNAKTKDVFIKANVCWEATVNDFLWALWYFFLKLSFSCLKPFPLLYEIYLIFLKQLPWRLKFSLY